MHFKTQSFLSFFLLQFLFYDFLIILPLGFLRVSFTLTAFAQMCTWDTRRSIGVGVGDGANLSGIGFFSCCFFFLTTTFDKFLFSYSFLPVLILYYLLHCTSPRIYSSFDEVPSTNPSLSFLVQQITAWYLPRYCTTRMSFSFFFYPYIQQSTVIFFWLSLFSPHAHSCCQIYYILYIYIFLSEEG